MTVADTGSGVLAALGRVVGSGSVRAGGEADTVAGLPARWVAAPATPAALSDLLTLASGSGLTVVPRGEGTKLSWGTTPAHVDILVDMGRIAGIRAHHTDDLVVTVGAGTPVRALQAVLGRHGQRLAADPPSPGATVGGMIAAGEAGPLRLGHGTARDHLIGAEFVRADGTITRTGGRVVKNVAGYDLGKLLYGSYGTLGIITSATFRLQPVPPARMWATRTVHTPLEVYELVDELLASPLVPAAIEMDLPGAPEPSVAGGSAEAITNALRRRQQAGTIAVLFEGSVSGTAARATDAVRILGRGAVAARTAPAWWGTYPFTDGDVAVKLAVPVADLHAAAYTMRDSAGAPVALRGSVGTGVVYASLPATKRAAEVLDAVRTTLIARGGFATVLCAPPETRASLDVWGPVPGVDLMRAVKDRFDPGGVFASGRYAGGI